MTSACFREGALGNANANAEYAAEKRETAEEASRGAI